MIRTYFREQTTGFFQFIREQGVMGLALGFILGGSVSKVVSSFSNDIINPVLALLLGSAEGIETFAIGPVLIGSFISNIIDFLFIATAVYMLFKLLGLDKLDIKKP